MNRSKHQNRPLFQLARLYGIQPSYVGIGKQRFHADPESIVYILRALGSSIRDVDDAQRTLEEEQSALQSGVEPVLVAWDGRCPDTKLPRGCKAELILEGGGGLRWPPRSILPRGYHRLHVSRPGFSAESLIISAPMRAHFPSKLAEWGVFAPLYSLHSKRSPQAGDLTDLETLSELTRNHGGRVVSTLPLLASFLDTPFEPSPYSPVSRLFWNEFYIDPARVPEFALLPEALQTAHQGKEPGRLVDYAAAMAQKRKILEAMAQSFFRNGSEGRRSAFRKFVRVESEVRAYSRFQACTEQAGKGWHAWPSRPPRAEESREEFHLYVQWVLHDQLRDLASRLAQGGSLLYLDLPVGLHWDAFDTWRFRDLFVHGVQVGAPPDPVFTAGQNWQFQPFHPKAMRADGYRYAIAVLRNHLRYAKLLRIDHVMGLHRLFWIPEGAGGDKGVYVEYPPEEMYAVLSLESHRAGAGIVGENLGIVPPQVNRAMNRHNIRQLYVAQYETVVGETSPRRTKSLRTTGHASKNPAPLRPPSRGSVASLNTHDMFPFQAFLDGSDIDARLRLKLLKPEAAALERKQRASVRKALQKFAGKAPLRACLDFLAKSSASVVLVNLEDLWHETSAQNIPSTTTEHPNWRRRMRYSMERLKRELRNMLASSTPFDASSVVRSGTRRVSGRS